MKKIYPAFIRCFLFTALFIVIVTGVHAQNPQYFSTGTGSTNSFPFASTTSNKVQWVYTPSQFSATPISDNITDVYIRASTAVTNTVYSNITIKLGYTTLGSFTSGPFETGLTTVYVAASQTISTTVDGWIKFTLQTPFFYDGVQNLLVEISQTAYSGTGFSVRQNSSGGNLRLYGGVASTTGTAATGLLNFGFDLYPAGPCTDPPTPGNVGVTQNPVCSGTDFTLSVTGGTGGSGQTYQWQSSPDSTTWTDIAGATAKTLTTNQSATKFYRLKVTCSGGTPVTSAGLKVTTPTPASGNYTINGILPTGGNNFATFTEAIDYLKCGINGPVVLTVAAASGPYDEQITIPQINGASAINTITIKGNMSTLKFNSSNSNLRAGITLDGADHIKIDSLIIDGTAGTYGWGILFTNAADSNRVRGCVINTNNSSTSTGYAPIVFSGSVSSPTTAGNTGNYDTIVGNVLNGGYYGLIVYGSNTAGDQNLGNAIINNTITDTHAYGIYLLYQSGTLVSGNDISRRNRTTTATTMYCIAASTNSLGIMIEKNRVHNMFDLLSANTATCHGIYLASSATTAAQPMRVINNLVYNIGGNGVVYGINNSTTAFMSAYHNTIALDGQSATTAGCYGIYQTGSVDGIDVRNNLVSITRSGSGTKRAVWFNTTTATITSNRNVLYMNVASGSNNNLVQFGTTNYLTLNDWKASNGNMYDQQSVSADPLFFNPGSGDYTPGEPGINGIGANLGIMTDILGAPRGPSPDPGAYEFSVAGLDAALTWVAPQNPVSAGMKTVTVNLANTQTVAITSASISYTDGTNVVTQNFSGLNITTGNAQQLSFTTQYNLIQSVNMRAYINLVNGVSDASQTNDTTALQNLCLQLSGNYTINSNLPTGGSNYHSFTEAAAQLVCGGVAGPVVFTVEPGTIYVESFTLPQINGASATNTITFKGNMATLSYSAPSSAERTAIILNGADHVSIDSLIVDVSAGATYGWGITLTGQADSNRITNCKIINNTSSTASNYAGIVINGSLSATSSAGNNGNGNVIAGNVILGGYYGMYIYGSTSVYNKRNIIRNNTITDFLSYGIYVNGNDSISISKNNISKPSRTNAASGYGINVAAATNVLIEKNKIHNMSGGVLTSSSLCYPIYIQTSGLSAAAPNRAENNLIYDINNGAGTIYGIYATGYNNWNYYHNTIVLDHAAATAGITYGLNLYGTSVNVKNNIIFIARGGTGAKYCLYYTTTGVTSSNNNVLVNTSTGGTTNSIGYYNAGYASLAAWQAANSMVYDQQSWGNDPQFLNPGNGSFLPTNSLIDNKGAPVGVSTDLLDSTRSMTTPDMGAYEFSTLTAGLNMGAQALITPAVSAKGCYGSAETVTIRIHNSSTSTHNFATNPVTVTTNVSGMVTQVLSATINTGTLASDATLDVPMTQTLDMSIPGGYTFSANISLPGDVNPANDAIVPMNLVKNLLAAGIVSASPDSYCSPAPVNPALSVTLNDGYNSLQWKQSATSNGLFSNIAGATTAPYTVTTPLTQTMYYKLYATCGTLVDSSSPVAVTYSNPQVTGTTPGSRCGTGTVNLSATASAGATLNWYTAATGGSAVATGSTFTTPSISANTNYYVSASLGGNTGYVGKTGIETNASGTGGGLTSYINFDALSNFMLQTVDIFPYGTGAGTVTIELRTSTGTPIMSRTVNATGTTSTASPAQTVSLNFPITGGASYRLGVTAWGPNITNLYRDDSNVSYPYTIPGTVSITSSSLTGYYYFFYNWKVSTGCEGPRTAVLARTDDCPMPVTLVNFTGEKQGDINKLQWTTSTEVNNAGFELERSADGKNFSKLAFVASKADGNSNQTLNYVYYDERPLMGNGYYRLKQVDKDGKFTYSNIVLIKGSKVKEIMITSVYPNPADRELNLIITSPTSEKVTLVVTDMTGKVISQTSMQVSAGDNLQKLQVNQLASGTYFIKTICANGCESQVQKFVKQ